MCQRKQTKESFSAAAWKATKPNRRVCLLCQSKTRGSWKCATCHQRKTQQQFSHFIAKRPSGEDGTQTCDACREIIVQAAVHKRAAVSSRSRLEPLRKKLRQRQVLCEAWEAIAAHRQKRISHALTSESDATSESITEKAINQSPPQEKRYVYACPFCQGFVTTSVVSGNVDHRRVCGKQFRVEDGLLRPTQPTSRFAHTCPTCGTSVQSTKQFGRIQSKHKQPNGRICPVTQWHIKADI